MFPNNIKEPTGIVLILKNVFCRQLSIVTYNIIKTNNNNFVYYVSVISSEEETKGFDNTENRGMEEI